MKVKTNKGRGRRQGRVGRQLTEPRFDAEMGGTRMPMGLLMSVAPTAPQRATMNANARRAERVSNSSMHCIG